MTTSAHDIPAKRVGWEWLTVFIVVYGIWVWLPFLAPVLMRIGWETPARGIYAIYSFFCHQLPQRSYFLFGEHLSYSLADIQAVWSNTTNPLVLRKFIGTPIMGWKVAWSDRMISFYGGIWVLALLWRFRRHKIKALPWWGMFLFLAPMVLDGGSHFVSELISGFGTGFRDSNLWLAQWTNYALPSSFYSGDMLGSFNSWMRWITGLLAAFGLVWFLLPVIQATYSNE